MYKSITPVDARTVCFVGISGKPGASGPIAPLSEKTLSGKIVSKVEEKLRTVSQYSLFVRDNLVQEAPLCRGKLRYPTSREMKSEWKSFERRLDKTESNVVILLGALVADFFKAKRNIQLFDCPFADGRLLKWAGVDQRGLIIIAVAHPSYVGIYARKRVADYVDAIFMTAQAIFSGIQTRNINE